jgi:hypothetical protein
MGAGVSRLAMAVKMSSTFVSNRIPISTQVDIEESSAQPRVGEGKQKTVKAVGKIPGTLKHSGKFFENLGKISNGLSPRHISDSILNSALGSSAGKGRTLLSNMGHLLGGKFLSAQYSKKRRSPECGHGQRKRKAYGIFC